MQGYRDQAQVQNPSTKITLTATCLSLQDPTNSFWPCSVEILHLDILK